jgi:hypothetical protein
LTKKPTLPSAAELDNNSRSASAKLRVFEKDSGQWSVISKNEWSVDSDQKKKQ